MKTNILMKLLRNGKEYNLSSEELINQLKCTEEFYVEETPKSMDEPFGFKYIGYEKAEEAFRHAYKRKLLVIHRGKKVNYTVVENNILYVIDGRVKNIKI